MFYYIVTINNLGRFQNIRIRMITQGTFCYWDCKSDPDALILLINACFTLVITVFAAIYCNRYRRSNTLQHRKSRSVYAKFIGIIVWGFSILLAIAAYVITIVYSIVVYAKIYRGKDKEEFWWHVTEYSKAYAFIETVPALLVQTLLFYTVKTMMTHSIAHLLQQMIEPTPAERKTYKFILKYERIRLLLLFPCWILILMPFDSPTSYEIVTQIKILTLMIDCAIIVVLLRFCHRYMVDHSTRLLGNDQRNKNQLLSETRMLTICGVCRFITDMVYYIILPFVFSNLNTEAKPCIQQAKDHLDFSIGYLIVGTFFMHHFCIIVLLRIYRPTNNDDMLEDKRISEDANKLVSAPK